MSSSFRFKLAGVCLGGKEREVYTLSERGCKYSLNLRVETDPHICKQFIPWTSHYVMLFLWLLCSAVCCFTWKCLKFQFVDFD